MNKLVLVLLCVLCQAASDVVVLTDENFEDTIKNNSVVMVKFYAPWCGHCKNLAPEYEQAASLAKQQKLPYMIAELDATIHRITSDKQEIQGFPTIKLFINSEVVEYLGERNAEAILNFIKKNVMPVKKLKSTEEIENLKKSGGLRCIMVGDVLDTFVGVAKSEEKFEFFSAEYEDMVKVFPNVTKGCIVLLKDFDEGFAKLTKELTEVNLKEFLETEMLPTVNTISQKVFDQVFKPNTRIGVFLLRSDNDPNLKTYQTEFFKVAKSLKSRDFVFIETNGEDNWGHRARTVIGIEDQPLPLLAAALTKDSVIKYLHKGDINEKNIKDFVERVSKGRAEAYYKSEPIPSDNSGPIYTVVSKSFKKEVLDNDNDIMVKFYTPYCGHCRKLAPVYERLAEGMAINKKLKFMEVDVSKNDIEGHPITSVPVMKLFPGKNKTGVQVFSGERKENVIAEFIQKHSSYQIEIPDFLTSDCESIEIDDL
jgi:protein disulfide-isomerase A1